MQQCRPRGAKNKKVPYFIRTRDVNKSGADGVYARFLMNGKLAPKAEFGASGAKPVRIFMEKANCFPLRIISVSLCDYKGQTGTSGELSDLNQRTAFNAEVCFKRRVPVSAFTSIYVRRQKDCEIDYVTLPPGDELLNTIAQMIVTVKNRRDAQLYGLAKGRKEDDIKRENTELVLRVGHTFRGAGFSNLSGSSNEYYKFTR